MAADLFVGVTSWNSQLFLPSCLKSIRETTRNIPVHLHVIDNCSVDQSAEIALGYGAAVTVQKCTQAEALNFLIETTRCTYTLLIHADVVLLNPYWLEICADKLSVNTVLVSPEDIGCGPLTRPFGANKPESSFMLFKTTKLKSLRKLAWKKNNQLIWPYHHFDFSGGHLTHNMPKLLESRGCGWFPMNVYVSNMGDEPYFIPKGRPQIWSQELSYLRYGLGNFYGIEGKITHYHNWYDRVVSTRGGNGDHSKRGKEFPAEFINDYSDRFLRDYTKHQVDYPRDLRTDRVPRAL